MTPGIHLVHKPVGPTSFSLVQRCIESARALQPAKRPRICHGGTLDPFASGLLLILAGPATRLFDHLHGVPKVYEASVRWGVETDNGDPLGRVTFQGDASGLSDRQLEEPLANFVGWHDQVPPMTSARRIGGERAYVRAHRGEVFEMPATRVYLHEARWLGHDLPRESRLRVVVRGGYYVRALARDLGRALGCGAHVGALARTAIGPWTDPGPDRVIDLHGRDVLPWLSTRMLSDQEVGELRQGRAIDRGEVLRPDWSLPVEFAEPDAPVRAFHQGRFVFLLGQAAGRLEILASLGRGV
ncbi:MAG TPA: tRNA pseudouridine(55) synthase TruB [Tepidisphaeraceae bacterium]|jgi:tRNA pseudouridine55 synthase